MGRRGGDDHGCGELAAEVVAGCQGQCSAVRTALMRMHYTQGRAYWPESWSRSQQEIDWRGVGRERVYDLLSARGGGGVFGHWKWPTRRRWCASTTRTKRMRRRAVGTVKKS